MAADAGERLRVRDERGGLCCLVWKFWACLAFRLECRVNSEAR